MPAGGCLRTIADENKVVDKSQLACNFIYGLPVGRMDHYGAGVASFISSGFPGRQTEIEHDQYESRVGDAEIGFAFSMLLGPRMATRSPFFNPRVIRAPAHAPGAPGQLPKV